MGTCVSRDAQDAPPSDANATDGSGDPNRTADVPFADLRRPTPPATNAPPPRQPLAPPVPVPAIGTADIDAMATDDPSTASRRGAGFGLLPDPERATMPPAPDDAIRGPSSGDDADVAVAALPQMPAAVSLPQLSRSEPTPTPTPLTRRASPNAILVGDATPSASRVIRRDVSGRIPRPQPAATHEAAVLRQRSSTIGSFYRPRHSSTSSPSSALLPERGDSRSFSASWSIARARSSLSSRSTTMVADNPRFDERAAASIEAQLDAAMEFLTRSPSNVASP